MSAETQAVLEQALRLSQEERSDLARKIIRTLDEEPSLSEDEWWAAWGPEIRHRLEQARSGEDPGIPAEDVFTSAEAKLRARAHAQSMR